MKKRFLNYCERIIRNNKKDVSEEEVEVIIYGLESLYLTNTKIILIFLLAFILGIAKEVLIMLLCYNIYRIFAFGLHSKNSIGCLMTSLILFIGGTYACIYLTIPRYVKIIGAVILITLILIYAPADTEKRPLINKKKRIRFKVLSVLISILMSLYFVINNNSYLSNYLFIGFLEEVIMILPITYKLMGLSYNNYKTYK